jgi:hypothetical protein
VGALRSAASSADGGFWQFMRTRYQAHLVVAEVLSRGPGKNEILQVANYLNPRGTGLFALILARADLDQAAGWTCREQWVHYSKLIVGLSDEDVVQMVRTKTGGGDPAELVRQKSRTSGWASRPRKVGGSGPDERCGADGMSDAPRRVAVRDSTGRRRQRPAAPVRSALVRVRASGLRKR